MVTVSLDALGISILLPIGEYVLNYDAGKIPDTYSWKILKKIFLILGTNRYCIPCNFCRIDNNF